MAENFEKVETMTDKENFVFPMRLELGPFKRKDGTVFRLRANVDGVALLSLLGVEESVQDSKSGEFGPWTPVPVPADKK
ncbi:MAG: hypothetical protein ACOYS2_02440 [Patescibacteria group bacterium]